jgi:hypothetical protein
LCARTRAGAVGEPVGALSFAPGMQGGITPVVPLELELPPVLGSEAIGSSRSTPQQPGESTDGVDSRHAGLAPSSGTTIRRPTGRMLTHKEAFGGPGLA